MTPACLRVAAVLLASAGTSAHASLVVLDPGAQPLQDPATVAAGGWVLRPQGSDPISAWSLFPMNGQNCCVMGDAVLSSAVVLAAPTPGAAPTGSVLTLEDPGRRTLPKASTDAFGGPTTLGAATGLAHGEKNLGSMVAAGLARGSDWSWALALRDTVLPEFDLGHCGHNQAVCGTWVDRPEVVAFRSTGVPVARALALDRFLGSSVTLPELDAESASLRR